MKMIIQKYKSRMAAVAVALAACSGSSAAELSDILTTLQSTSGGHYTTTIIPNFSFKATGKVDLFIVESTVNTAFGFEKGGNMTFLTANRANTSGNGFGVFAATGNGSQIQPLPLNTSIARVQFANNGNDTNLGGGTSNLIDNVLGTGSFNFVLKSQTLITPDNFPLDQSTSGTVQGFGSGLLNSSTSGAFKAYELTNGNNNAAYKNGSYLIAFEVPGSGANPPEYTFAAIVSGVVNPEPASIAMLGTGVVFLAGLWRRRRNAANAVVVAV